MITMDFETFSTAGYSFNGEYYEPLVKGKPGLMGVNASVYAAHPSTEIISLAYEGKLWVPGCAPPTDLLDYIRGGGLIEAHNSLFEYYIWNYVGARCHGWPHLPLEQTRCSKSKARAYGLPGALDMVAGILRPDQKKDPRGKRLIQLLSIPKRPTAKDKTCRRLPADYPELYLEMYEYNLQDVVAERAVSPCMPDLSPFELQVWQLDQRINVRGVQIDTESLKAFIRLFHELAEQYTAELQAVTGGAVNTIDEMSKGSAGDSWLKSIGVNLSSLDQDHVTAALRNPQLPPAARRAFEIRQLLGSSSIKKLFAIDRMVMPDGRLRDLFEYCGAERTGRFAGRGAQPQNLKNSGPKCRECSHCGSIFGDLERCPDCGSAVQGRTSWCVASSRKAAYDARLGLGRGFFSSRWPDPVGTIAACMRGLIIARPGHRLIGSDYSAIEAVVLAALAGEEWRLEVFRTHGKIYEMSASKITGIPFQEFLDHKERTGEHHPMRKKIGKIAELGSGYGGWIGAWKNFGAGDFMSDGEIKSGILKWREDSPAIVEFWGGQYRKDPYKWEFYPELYGVEGITIQALQNPKYEFGYRLVSMLYDPDRDVLICRLPSGRALYYHQPRLSHGTDPRGLACWDIHYRGGKGFTPVPTYGSKLVENITQAVSRDILAPAMLRVEKAGYPIALHVHDEIIAEVPDGFGSIEEFEKLMMVREPWFSDWPIRASGGWEGREFRK